MRSRQQQIIAAFEALGGVGELQGIYKWTEQNGNLTSHDLSASRYGGTQTTSTLFAVRLPL